MSRAWKQILLVVAVLAIPLAGYAVMHGVVYLFPVSRGSVVVQIAVTAIIIGLGLGIPYWMLKLSLRTAKLGNPKEKEMRLEDIPRDHKQPH